MAFWRPPRADEEEDEASDSLPRLRKLYLRSNIESTSVMMVLLLRWQLCTPVLAKLQHLTPAPQLQPRTGKKRV